MNDRNDDSGKASDERRSKLRKAGVAVGIGSAAIVAGLLYASRVKNPARKRPTAPPDATD
jgi:hypothetical protein